MSISGQRTGAYYNWSVGMLTTSRHDGSPLVAYQTTSHFQITKWRVRVSCLSAYQRRHWNGLAQSFGVEKPAMYILIVDYGCWFKTSSTASQGQRLRLMPAMYTPMGISSRLKMPKRSKRRLDRGVYLAALRAKGSGWCWASVISRWVIDDPSAFVRSSVNLIPMLDACLRLG